MRGLPIRKISGVGRVNERLLDSIGVKVLFSFHYCMFVLHSFVPFDQISDMWRHLRVSRSAVITG